MKRSVALCSEFLGLDYEIIVTPFVDEDYPEEDGYVAFIPELPGLEAYDKTPVEAIQLLEEYKETWFEVESTRNLVMRPKEHFYSEKNKKLRKEMRIRT